MSVLCHPDLTEVFSSHGQAEISVMGTFLLNNEERAVSGRIDRLAVTEDRVILLDYKTNRTPPENLDAVPLSHRAQLAIYREILKPLYPGKKFECLLVYTETGSVITIPPVRLSQTLAELKTS